VDWRDLRDCNVDFSRFFYEELFASDHRAVIGGPGVAAGGWLATLVGCAVSCRDDVVDASRSNAYYRLFHADGLS